MADEYVPTEPEVNGIRDSWACAHVREEISLEQAREAFDRWFASELAEAWDEGSEATAEHIENGGELGPRNPYRADEIEKEGSDE